VRNWGILVSAIEPGPIDTPIWSKTFDFANKLANDISPEALALYESDLAAIRRAAERSMSRVAPTRRVVKAVIHALTAKRPKTRYYLGWDVRICFKSFRMFSDRFRDWVVRKASGLR